MDKIENLTDKPITEFTTDDTIYITKMKGGHSFRHLCQFVSYEKGMVTGKVISFEPVWAYRQFEIDRGLRVSARLSKCYLWGMLSSDCKMKWPHCNWFDGKTKKVKGAN